MTDLITGVFSPADDKQTRRLIEQINSLQAGAVQHFAFPEPNGVEVSLERDVIMWGDVDVSQLKTAYIRGFSYTNPVVPKAMDDTDWSLWQYDYISTQQTLSFLYSSLTELDRRGVEMHNPPGLYLDVSMKINLLETLRHQGVALPELLCTNNREAADSFSDSHEGLLWRPATGRAAWQLCQHKQLDILIDESKPPVILSSIEPGLFLRCYISQGVPVLCLKYSPPAQIPLERMEVYQVVEASDFHPQLIEIAKNINMKWGSISCTLHEGKICLYDIDADPILTALPTQVQDYLSLCLAHALIARQNIPTAQALYDCALARELPFLRRMLTVLFEIEYRKYAS